MPNYRDRSSELREVLNSAPAESDDDNSDIDNPGSDIPSDEEIFNFSSGSEDEFLPQYEYVFDDSGVNYRPNNNIVRPTWQYQPTTSLAVAIQSPTSGDESEDQHVQNQPVPWIRVYPPEQPVDVSSKFIVRTPGARNCPLNHKPIEYFKLFISDGIVKVITRETNAYAKKLIDQKRASGILKQFSRVNKWQKVTIVEIRKFLAIILNMGLTRRKNICDYWHQHPADYIPWYGSVMSLRRFQAIHAMLHLSSRRSPPKGNPRYDPWVKVRPFLDAANSAFKRHWVPHQDLIVNESLIGMKNRCSFIQYMPNKKHTQYGLKKFELVESKTSYVLHTTLYSGKDYLADGPHTFTHRVVADLIEKSGCYDKGYHVFTDNFYIKLPLAKSFIERDTFLTGTTNKNTKDLSKSVIQAKLGGQESIYYRQDKVLLVGYKQKHTRKPVYLLTTAYHAEDREITSRSGRRAVKPIPIIDMYNKLMGGIDNKDKSIYHISSTRPTRRYWKKIFFNILDMCMLNAYIVYCFQCQPEAPMPRRRFVLDIVNSLTTQKPTVPFIPPSPRGDGELHKLDHLPGKNLRVCAVCPSNNKKRTSFWCPGCNAGIHKECYLKLQHYWRPDKKKRQLERSDSD
uniref:PiggyBac transposable element-derived protein domain-containing protein n=1 Tax=Clastoptera arizonana TaxID=38151 RepID=A0A1B6DC22_9HEMI